MQRNQEVCIAGASQAEQSNVVEACSEWQDRQVGYRRVRNAPRVFFSPSRGARLCTDQLSRSLVVFSIAVPTGLSGMITLNRLPFAARFASGKVAANVVDLAAIEEEALRRALFERGDASSASVRATNPAATAAVARMAAMTVQLGWCIATVGRPLSMRAKLIGCVPILTAVPKQRRVIANTIRLLRPLGPRSEGSNCSSAWKAEAA